jgi:hypothetical protein
MQPQTEKEQRAASETNLYLQYRNQKNWSKDLLDYLITTGYHLQNIFSS